MKFRCSATIIMTLLILATCSSVQAQRDRRTPQGTPAVAKNVVAVLAEPSRGVANNKSHFIIDAGTRILVFRKKNRFGNLVFTEDGLWGFIPDNSYYTNFSAKDFGFANEFVFATRDNIARIDEFVSFNFSPSTTYELISENETHFKIIVDGKGYKGIANEKFPTEVPKNYFKKASNVPLERKNTEFFARANIDGFIGFQKECHLSSIARRAFSGGGSLGVDFKFFSIDVGMDTDISLVTSFDKSKFVIVSYFTNSNSRNIHKIIRMEECGRENRGQIWFEYYNQSSRLVIDKEFIDLYNLPFHPRTHQITISCYNDFDKYLSVLMNKESFSRVEAMFIIARTARWVGHGNIRNCERT